jgi:hypothetical protein
MTVNEISTMAIVNCRVTRTPLKEILVVSGLSVFFRLSTALEEEILKAGIILKITLNTMIIARETSKNPGELINF